jgi:peptide/nickel transport system permease protein
LVPLGGRALYRDRPDRAETWAAWRALPEQQRPLAIFPLLTTRPNRPYPAAVLLPPGSMLDDGSRAWLGTDIDTEDVLANLVHGVRVSLTIGFLATALSIAIGTMVGAASGYLGGRMDMLLQRVVEIMLCFPTFILVLAVVAALGPSLINIVLVIGLTGWADTARLVRGEFLAQMGREYVLAARALGYGGVRIALRHILPNTAGPLLVSATFGVAGAVFLESGLAFLGLADPTVASWGAILEQGRRQPGYLWLILTPGIAIFVLVLSLNTVGDSLRAALGGRRR